ncbi:F-box protein At3g07870-like [Papaver somniferum]|uniref:F-box protein At3g07870-like n=1 Tax=Papaver somniferum TaxID=3469 RepID=UPI000E6FA6F3|nr:F-box protein At3g07870-like [Papaver somniferum]
MHICMEHSLPSEIATEILSRLPTDSVMQCRQVCKTWEHLLCDPSFAHKHLHQISQIDGNSNLSHSSLISSKVGSGFLVYFKFTRERGCQLYYGEYDDQRNMKLKRINQTPKHHQSIVGSCSGLICFSKDGRGPHCSLDYEPTYICNPITGEYVNFPGLPWEEKLQSMVCGFGYHHSSNKYKIVRIYYIENQPLGKVQVYTLGSGIGWKDLGKTTYSLRYSWQIHPFGIFANGALHWLDMEQNIVSFDLAEEKFYLLPPPPFFPAVTLQNYFKLRVSGGCLCFFHQIKTWISRHMVLKEERRTQ